MKRFLYPVLFVFGLATGGSAYVLEGQRWSSSPVSMQMNLSATSYRLQSPPRFPLFDSATSWDSVYSAAAGVWNPYMANMKIATYTSNNPAGGQTGDGVNEAFFGSSLGGSNLDPNTLALTIYSYDPSTNFMIEADTVFNRSISWNSYRGPLLGGVIDFRRVAIHELGHILGLDHPDTHGQTVIAIMNSVVSNTDAVTADDVAGVQALYGAPATTPPLSATPVFTNFISYSGDFNGDGRQDILWRNTQTGEVRIWYMNGATILSNDHVATVGLDWKIVGIGDFDGDGFSDILWENVNDGSFAIWTMRGDSFVSHQYSSPGYQWSITGVADMDHNGLADILWRNVVTGEVRVWRSISPFSFSSEFIGVAGLDWNLVGTADLFGNGLPELIWRNQNSGEVRAWQLSGDAIVADVSLGFPPLNWEIVGFGDFNGDGRQDILWRNTADGSVDAWIMIGFAIAAQWFPGAVTLDWQIRAAPDVNGNHVNSILWSNVATGQQVIWFSNLSTFVSGSPFAGADPAWAVQPVVSEGTQTRN
jgi:hypothetical protein